MSGLTSTLGLVGERPAEEILRRLTLDITRKLDGMLHGDFMGLVPGRGTEPGETREYAPGDDVRRIDWNVTARTQSPHVRETIADRELEAWLLIDRSSRMDFGTAECEKRDLALAAAAGMGLLVTRGGNRVGGVLLRGSETTTVPPRSGRKHLLGLLERTLASERSDGSGPVDLAAGLRSIGAMAPRRGLVVVISDFDGDPAEWGTALGIVSLRHSVLCIEVTDPRDSELPRAGLIEFVDPATGTVREVNTDSAKIRADYAAAAAQRSEEVRSTIRGAGADHLVLSTDGDWVMDLARHVSRRRHRAEVMAGGSQR
ncbi:MAG: DUF58 domain-containing protein [Microthrixaceae bacterium]